MSVNSAAVKEYLLELQDLIVTRLEQVDGKKFIRDKWQREAGGVGIGAGGGISCILEEGNVFERGGVAFSHVKGDKMPASATAHRPELAGCMRMCACSWHTSLTAKRCSGSAAAWI